MYEHAPGLLGIDPEAIADHYERRRLDEWSDARLAENAASLLGVPLATAAPVSSFVLHAPLELLARVGLLAYVTPHRRRAARLMILSLVARYERTGEMLKPSSRNSGSNNRNRIARLIAAINAGDLTEVDTWAPQLLADVPWLINHQLADSFISRLGAAGHGNIYLYLAETSPVGSLGPALLWPVVRELAKAPNREMTLGALSAGRGPTDTQVVSKALARLPNIGPADVSGIAPMVERAAAKDVVSTILDMAGGAIVCHPRHASRALLRCAALMMLQGPIRHAPYGWTHCLTLAQAASAQGRYLADPARATAVAAAYVAAHWSCLATQPFDPSWQPERLQLSPKEALDSEPRAAVSAVWHASEADLTDIEQALVDRALSAHDAHHVKYTWACLRAAIADRPARRLFLTAAAHLSEWWATNPNGVDLPAASTSPPTAVRPRTADS